MSKRARYDGPYEEVQVFDSEAGIYAGPIDTVKRGGLLSADAPARIRDELTSGDHWTEVQHNPPGSATPPPAEKASTDTKDGK